MTPLQLPRLTDGRPAPALPASAQISIIGANGSGKTRFMREMARSLDGKAYFLSALDGFFPEKTPSRLPGSIDALYERAVKEKHYLRTDAMSELDKLCYMLVADEFEEVMKLKSHWRDGNSDFRPKATRLDRVIEIWEKIFPGNRILHDAGQLLFSNSGDSDQFSAARLSQGEKAVLYYAAATLYAMPGAVIFIDQPTLFLHPAILNSLWNAIENLRPDCRFVYNSVDVDFVNSRTQNICIWVKSYRARDNSWDYQVLDSPALPEDLFLGLMGSRKPVLFIEGDATHSIDARLYGLVFTDYTVRPLGSCEKVIESTRSFNDLKYLHHLDSHGIVDRDRRTGKEVEYLRRKQIFVPEVAEVENIFLMEEVVAIMARRRGKDPKTVPARVRQNVMREFSRRAEEQALMHVRHIVKREMECRVDGRFTCITAMELHLRSLADKLRPRERYEQLLAQFREMVETGDYQGVLRVFNHKPMLADSDVARLLGFRNKDEYIAGVLAALKGNSRDADALRNAIKYCFRLTADEKYLPGALPEAPARKKPQTAAPAPETAHKERRRQRHGRNGRPNRRS